MAAERESTTPTPTDADDVSLKKALQLFRFGMEAESKQRERELNGLKFFAGEQWPDYVVAARSGQNVNGKQVGQKPCLTINKVKQPVQQIVNQAKNANLGILLRPEKDAAIADAKVRQGLIRHIQEKSRAKIARDWAFDRAAQVGRGYYRIDKKYCHTTVADAMAAGVDALHDQELAANRILNQGNVLLSVFAKQPDWSDGDWGFVWDDMPEDDFHREYPDAKTTADDETITALADQAPDWIRTDATAGRTIRVAEFWQATYEKTTLQAIQLPDNGGSLITDQPEKKWPEGATAIGGPLTIMDRKVTQRLMTAIEWLGDATKWEGKHIPIIPVIGNEFNLNGKRLWNGEVEDSQDAQRLFNYTASAIAYTTAIAQVAPFIIDPKQIEGYKEYWDTLNTRGWPYLPAHSYNEQGQAYPEPKRNIVEPPIQALALMLNQADSYIQATTAVPDTSLGRFDPKKASGRAIEALQRVADVANSNYLDNLAHVSMTLEGIILNEMLQYVYDRPGRIVEILGDDEEQTSQQVMLGQPFMAQPGQPPQAVDMAQMPPGQPLPPSAQFYDLSKGTYAIVVDVIKSEPTRRTETQAMLTELAASSPQAASALVPLIARYSDLAGADEAAKVLEKLLWPPDMQGDGKGVNWEMQAKQAAMQIQQMTQIIEQMKQVIQQKQIEQQTDIEIARINAEATVKRAEVTALGTIRTTQDKTRTDKDVTAYQAGVDMALQNDQQAFEAEENAKDRAHESRVAATQAAVAMTKAAQQPKGNGQ